MLSIQPVECGLRVCIEGALTIYQVIDYKPQLLDGIRDARDVQVDLAEVDEIDGAGLQLLLFTRSEVLAAGARWQVVAHSEASREVLSLAGLATEFDLVDVLESEVAP
jgi:anti-sigma B factor antagonist